MHGVCGDHVDVGVGGYKAWRFEIEVGKERGLGDTWGACPKRIFPNWDRFLR